MKKSLSNQELKWVDTHCHLQLLKHKISEIDFSNIEYLIIPGVDVDSSGNLYWLTSAQYHDGSNKSVFVYKTNSSGTMQWDKYFVIPNPGGPSNYTPYMNKIKLVK